METLGVGSECTVFRDSKGVLKCYDGRHEAKMAHEMQSTLSYFDLAPEVLSGVSKRNIGENTWLWGYYTEEAELLEECSCDEYYGCDICEDTKQERVQVCDAIAHWCGLEYTDYHPGNFGYIWRDQRWKMVCIDTGVKGFKDMTER